jgi:hypothetical protein
MDSKEKFNKLPPDPTGRDRVPPTKDLTGLFMVFGGLQEAGRRISPEPVVPAQLPDVEVRPYMPTSVESAEAEQ